MYYSWSENHSALVGVLFIPFLFREQFVHVAPQASSSHDSHCLHPELAWGCALGTKETETRRSLRERLRFHLFLVLASISV